MDLMRARSRWLARRLAGLLPALAAGLLVVLGLALRDDLRPSLRLFAVSAALLPLALLASLLARSVQAARAHAAGRLRQARSLRRFALPAGAAPGALALLAGLAVLPDLVPSPAPPPRAAVVASIARRAPRPAPPPPAPVLEESAAAPVLLDILPPLPSGLSDEVPGPEVEFYFPLPAHALAVEISQEADGDAFAFTIEGPGDSRFSFLLRTERSYLPSEGAPGQVPPSSVRIDTLYLAERGGDSSGAFAVEIDLPTAAWGSLRFASLGAAFSETGPKGTETSSDLALSRSTLDYVVRLAGHTKNARFDLSAGAGLSMDVLHGDADVDVDGRARLAPYVSVEAGIWQSGSVGLLLRAGQSIPVNVTGGSSATTDLSAVFRIDLTDRVSVHAGYRYLAVRLRDYERALGHEDGSDRFDASLSGPLLGVEIRF